MEVLKKLKLAREHIKNSDLKKQGRNDYSKYDYYTPEQINKLVFDAVKDLNLFNKFCLTRTELGLVAQLVVYDLDSGENELFSIATEIPDIKATNIAQQLGGAVTYSERYLLMIAYDIKNNNLDFDSKEPSSKGLEKDDERPWLTDKQKEQIIAAIRKGEEVTVSGEVMSIESYISYVKKNFRMKKAYREAIDTEMSLKLNKLLQ